MKPLSERRKAAHKLELRYFLAWSVPLLIFNTATLVYVVETKDLLIIRAGALTGVLLALILFTFVILEMKGAIKGKWYAEIP